MLIRILKAFQPLSLTMNDMKKMKKILKNNKNLLQKNVPKKRNLKISNIQIFYKKVGKIFINNIIIK